MNPVVEELLLSFSFFVSFMFQFTIDTLLGFKTEKIYVDFVLRA